MDKSRIRSVSCFYLVQADTFEGSERSIVDEKELGNMEEAIDLLKISEAPVKYLKFNLDGLVYKMYLSSDTGEYRITKEPILN